MSEASSAALEYQQRLFALLTEAVALEGDARDTLLEGAAPELAEEVRSLLADEHGDSFLEQTPAELLTPGGKAAGILEAGQKIGPYRILELLGAGGMGQVYLAAQMQPVRRRVALKLLRFSLDQPEVQRRFDTERQAMERLDHPNVGKILDAGPTDDGTPYLAMEYIVGEPITTYCDRHRLSLGARISLIIKVCRGLEHAHQCLLLHRDIKPSNVLVAEVDDRPVPKLIDFGIAKVLDPAVSASLSGLLIGTPSYMSPDTLDEGRDLDTRSDVYSLGLLLYELLVGVLPFEVENLNLASHLCRLDQEELEPPSSRFAALDMPRARVFAEHRGLSVDRLRRRLRGDLDAVAGKATTREREQRYGSAADLAADLERHLSHRPILAQPSSTWYRVAKLTRRYRAGAAAAAMVTLALILGFVTTSLALVRARQAEAAAVAQEEQARSLAGFESRQIDSNLIFKHLAMLIGALIEQDEIDEAERFADQGLDLARRTLPPGHWAIASAKTDVASCQWRRGDFAAAEAVLLESYRIISAQAGENNPMARHTRRELARLYDAWGRKAEAARYRQDAEMTAGLEKPALNP